MSKQKSFDSRVSAYALLFLVAALSVFPLFAQAQETVPELTGNLAFNIDSKSGRVERLAITIGDGGTGPYKAILTGEPTLPTHAIYRPRDLRPFGQRNLLPIAAFANGGCRNTSGEFRNLLSELASQGFLVIAIGPAGNAVVMGSEERTNMTAASELLDGVTWAIAENERTGSAYYHKIDTSKVAVMGQSCGAGQAIEVSADPRVTTTIAFNQGVNLGAGRGPNPAAGAANGAPNAVANAGRAGGAGRGGAPAATDSRYAPFAPALVRADAGTGRGPGATNRAEMLDKLHGPILFLTGGESDSGHRTALSNFEAVKSVPAIHAFEDVGHYPGTYRQPNGGAFAKVAGAWLKWQLRGDQTAGKMFMGSTCELCKDPKWTVVRKNLPE